MIYEIIKSLKIGHVSMMEIKLEKDQGRITISLAKHAWKESILKSIELGRPLQLERQRYKVALING